MHPILFLIDQVETRHLLTNWLGPHYAVITPPVIDETVLYSHTFDLCVVDTQVCRRMVAYFRSYQTATGGTALPLLLLLDDTTTSPADILATCPADIVADFVCPPLNPWEIQARVAALLRKRQVSADVLVHGEVGYSVPEHTDTEAALSRSQALLQGLIDNIPMPLFVKDLHGYLLLVNHFMAHALGFTPAQMVGRHQADLFPTEFVDQWREQDQYIISTGNTLKFDEKSVVANVSHMHVVKFPIYDQNGTLFAIAGITHDISVAKQVENALRVAHNELEQRVAARTGELLEANAALAQEIAQREATERKLLALQERLEHLIASSPVALFSSKTVPPYLITFMSDNISKIIGYTLEDIYDDPHIWINNIHPDDRAAVFAGMSRLLEQGYHEHDYRFCHKDGSYLWIYNQLKLARDEDGMPAEIIGSIHDMTGRKEAEALHLENVRLAATLAERDHAEDEIRRQAARAEALVRVAGRLNAQLDVQAVLHTICEEVARALNVPVVTVLLYDEKRQVFSRAADIGLPSEFRQNPSLLPRARFERLTSQHSNILVTPDVQALALQEVSHSDLIAQHNLRTVITVTLLRDDRVLGLLNVVTVGEIRAFTEDELALMQGLADQAAQALTNARQFESLEQTRDRLEERVKEAINDLQIANAELARSARLKDEFLAGMSHEIRTPLNAILGMTEVLQEGVYGKPNEKQAFSLRTIDESGRLLLALINDILDLSKIQAGKIDLEITTVFVESLCQVCMQFVRQNAHKKHLRLSTSIDHEVETIQADERRLKQILVNLLSNAVKFTPDGGEVGLEVIKEDQVIHFQVWDTGIGIAPDDQLRLFQPFVQIDNSLSRQHKGTGLGLALVSELAALHGGSVSLQSEPGRGSRFTVSLPLPAAEALDPEKPEQTSHATAEVNTAEGMNSPTPDSTGKQPLILLAEDNQINIDMLLQYLQSKGYRVVVARNGREAVDQARAIRPALILMDIQMPIMDGLEAIRRIRTNPDLGEVPIIAVTALAMVGDRERCLAAGANEYMGKPLHLRQLLHLIETYRQ